MPDVNGDEALAWLKADPFTRNIPVIVTTAFLHGPLVNRAIARGAAGIINKLFHSNRFMPVAVPFIRQSRTDGRSSCQTGCVVNLAHLCTALMR